MSILKMNLLKSLFWMAILNKLVDCQQDFTTAPTGFFCATDDRLNCY
jgi:hypothetical protein